jgi:alpha-galactosidase
MVVNMLTLFLNLLALLLSTIPTTTGLTAPNNVGKLPALGWNSWNAYNCNITEANFLSAAQKLVDLGLKVTSRRRLVYPLTFTLAHIFKDAGYEYVNIDDCYSQKQRDYTTHRIVPDFTKFPDGINATAQKVHAMGLKIGIYSSAGNYTCAGYPASLGYEDLDAETFSEWGMDCKRYIVFSASPKSDLCLDLKYDNCNVPSNWADDCESCIPDSDNHRPPEPHPNGTCS